MATKKKELLEQENTAPETTVTVENAPPPDEAQADMAAPADGGDLNELLASMDQPDEEATTIEDDGSLPELAESEMFGEMDTDATVADALPGDDDAALTEGSDSDDGKGASAVPADDGAADVPVSLFLERLRNRNRPSPSGPPAGKRPRRPKVWSRRKEFPQKQSLLSRRLLLGKMRRLMIVKRLRQKLLPLWPNRRQRQPLLPLLLPGVPPLPAAASLRS